MNESFVLSEAVADERFKALFGAISASTEGMGKLVAAQSGGKYDAASVTSIIALAFESLLAKGQTAFVDDIKDINQGFSRYRAAERTLDTAKNGVRQAKVTANTNKAMGGAPNASQGPGNGNGQSGSKRAMPSADMDNRAEQLAEDYIQAHPDMYDETAENVALIKAQIIKIQSTK